MAYSAGDIFVQVVPSFRNTQRLIQAWAKSSGIAGMLNEEVDRGLGGSRETARRQGAQAGDEFGREFGRTAKPRTAAAGDEAGGAFATRFRSRVDAALRSMPKAKIDADSTEAEKTIAHIREKLLSLRDAHVGVDLDAEAAMLELDRVMLRLKEVSGTGLNFDVEVDLASAMGEVEAFKTWVNRQKATLDVRVDHHNAMGILSQLGTRMSGLADQSNSTANAFRAFNGILFTAVTIGPALIPIAGVLAGTIGSIGPAALAAGAGIGVLALSLSGLKKGTDALVKQQEEIRAFGSATAATTKAVQLQMADLGPAGQEMAKGMATFREGYLRDLRLMNQAAILPGLKNFLGGLQTYADDFKAFTREVSTAWSEVATKLGEWVKAPEMRAFFDTMRAMAPVFTKQTADMLMNIGTGLAGILVAFAPTSAGVGNTLLALSQAFADWGKNIGQTEGFKQFVIWLQATGPKVFGLLANAVETVLRILIAIEPYTRPLIVALDALFAWINKLDPDTLGAIAFGVLALVAAFQAASVATTLFGFALNAVLTPVGAIVGAIVLVGAALAVFYQNSETFRYLVGRAWEWLKTTATAVWGKIQEVISVVFEWIANVGWPWLEVVLRNIGGAWQWLWDTILQPVLSSLWDLLKFVFEGLAWWWSQVMWPVLQLLGAALKWVWDTILFPFFSWLVPIIKTLGEAIGWLWTNVIDPAFRGIGTVVKWVWENLIQPALAAFGAIISWLWENIISPVAGFLIAVFKVIATVVGWVFNNIVIPIVWLVGTIIFNTFMNVIGPAITFVKGLFGILGAAISWVWENVIKPTINFISDHWDTFAGIFKFVYDHTIGPVIQGFKDNFDSIKGVFDGVVNFIRDHWYNIIEFVKKPIRFVIEQVVNRLIGAFNSVAEWFGSDKKISPVPTDWLNEAPPGKAEGGLIDGPYRGPKRDNVLIRANPREFMQPVASVDYYGVGVMEAMRRRAIPREMFSGWGVNAPAPRGRSLADGGQPDSGFSILDVFKGPAEWLKGLVGGWLEGIGSNPWAQVLTAIPRKIIDLMVEKIQSFFGSFGGGGPDVPMTGNPGNIITWRGQLFDELMVQRLMLAEQIAGTVFRIMQGSFSTRVAASGSTHAGGGAADYWPTDNNPAKAVLASRRAQIAAWWRRPWQGPWNDHIHGIAIGDPSASPAAQGQVRSYMAGGNGLGGVDDGPRIFDSGGWLPPGRWTVDNWTGQPEAILTADQWELMKRRMGGELVQIYASTTSTAEEIADEVLRAKRKLRVRGRY